MKYQFKLNKVNFESVNIVFSFVCLFTRDTYKTCILGMRLSSPLVNSIIIVFPYSIYYVTLVCDILVLVCHKITVQFG